MTLTNQSKQICTLSNLPQASLLDANSRLIELHSIQMPSAQTPPAPDLMQLAPNESAIVTLVWQNFCLAAPVEPIIARLTLTKNQYLDIKMNVLAVPGCDDKNGPSTLTIAPYSYPP
jgi:hypothetical protein